MMDYLYSHYSITTLLIEKQNVIKKNAQIPIKVLFIYLKDYLRMELRETNKYGDVLVVEDP